MKRQTGTAMQYVGSHSPVRGSLGKLADRVAAEEHKKEMEARRAKAHRVDHRIGMRVKFSDDVVREMRRLHEKELKSARTIAKLYEAGEKWVEDVLAYRIRSRHIL